MPTPIREPSFNPSQVDYCYNNIIKLYVKDLVEICNKDAKVNKRKEINSDLWGMKYEYDVVRRLL